MIYCNWAATSPHKKYNYNQAVQDTILTRTGISPNEFSIPVRTKIASLFNVPSAMSVVFGAGATDLLNKVLLGVPMGKNDEVITSIYAHNSILRPLHYLKERRGINVHYITPNEYGVLQPETLSEAITARTRLVVLTHASNVTGIIQPVKECVAYAHQKHIPVLLDCAQSAGFFPLDVQDINADAYVCSGHKALQGPSGIGILFISNGLHCEPVITGGSGIQSDREEQPEELPWRLEAGTPNYEAVSLLNNALDNYNNDIRVQQFKNVCTYYTRFVQELQNMRGIRIIGMPTGAHLPYINIIFNTIRNDEAAYILLNVFRIIVRPGLHCAPRMHKYLGTFPEGTIRLSFGPESDEKDFNGVLEALNKIQRDY